MRAHCLLLAQSSTAKLITLLLTGNNMTLQLVVPACAEPPRFVRANRQILHKSMRIRTRTSSPSLPFQQVQHPLLPGVSNRQRIRERSDIRHCRS
jgi:hypothetical protein